MRKPYACIYPLLGLVLLLATGCDTFLGFNLKDDAYREPSLSLYTPIRVVGEGQEVTIKVVAQHGSDYYFSETQQWQPAAQVVDTDWLQAKIEANNAPASGYRVFEVLCRLGVGPDMDDQTTRNISLALHVFPDLTSAYQTAIADAEVAEESEVVDTLWSIGMGKSYLFADYGSDGPQVVLMTWTQFDSYEQHLHDPFTTSWVTWMAIPAQVTQAANWASMNEEEVHLRLAQYLGLPPDTPKDRIALMWVKMSDLKRPSMDPEIDDRVAQLTWSEGADEEYRTWFEANMDYSDTGYPWTRLGYTYDWGNTENEVGASEYILAEGAEIVVVQVLPTAEFLQNESYMYYY